MAKTLISRPILAQICTPKFLEAINQPNLREWQKTISGPILARLARIRAPKTFFADFTSTKC